jgi:DDE superfamily endonuclease
VTAFGALDYGSGEVLTTMAPTGDAVGFGAFLDHLVTNWTDDHLVLVLDNASYHKTADLRAWFATHADRVSVLWLPTYSPHLNLIERVWRFVKSKLANHRLWHDLEHLQAAAQRLLDHTHATFAAPTYPHIALGQDFCEVA